MFTVLLLFCNKLNLPGMQSMAIHNTTLNYKGNIWLFWRKSIPTPSVVSITSHMITVAVGDIMVSGVHASVNMVQRRFLWSEMQMISDFKKPWIVSGDFNAVLSVEDKIGGRSPSKRVRLDFNECVDQCQLIQAPKNGLDFSWSNCQQGNKRILCHLDRAFFNLEWLQNFNIGVIKLVSELYQIIHLCLELCQYS